MPSVPSYRPRKKRKLLATSHGSNNALILDAGNVLPLILMVVGLFRWAVSLWGYSGFRAPPMHGDFEAQRHWMELTLHLPMAKWYMYDLQYWGLDYPPLTAYHSKLLGKIGSFINPAWFALDVSRGFESPQLKVYMRATVLVSEYLIYVPAIVTFLRRYTRMRGVHTWSASIALVAILLQPAIILIDHGHFQYNTVMLGLVVASLDAILAGRMLWAAIFFVGALGFKQMALYYAPIMFAFLLGVCVFPRIRILRLFCISLITLAAFAGVFAPLIIGAIGNDARQIFLSASPPALIQLPLIKLDKSSILFAPTFQLTQIIHRVFPFSRGIFEDKVANAWCAIHTFYKLSRFPVHFLQKLSLGATLTSIFIPCTVIFRHPRASLLLLALSTAAWGFFLFSFQVHEKSVLLPLLPMTLLLADDGGLSKETRAWVGWANILGAWTLFPLLKREDLRVPYFTIVLLWAYLLGLPPTTLETYRSWSQSKDSNRGPEPHNLSKLLHLAFYIGMVVWHVLEAFVPPPAGKPDLWVVLNVLGGASGFGIAYLWCLWKLIVQSRKVERKMTVKEQQKKRQ